MFGLIPSRSPQKTQCLIPHVFIVNRQRMGLQTYEVWSAFFANADLGFWVSPLVPKLWKKSRKTSIERPIWPMTTDHRQTNPFLICLFCQCHHQPLLIEYRTQKVSKNRSTSRQPKLKNFKKNLWTKPRNEKWQLPSDPVLYRFRSTPFRQ